MILKSQSSPWEKLKSTNFTDAAFGTLKSAKTRPIVGSGVIEMTQDAGGVTPQSLIAKFFGTNTDNQGFLVRIWGWDRCLIPGSNPAAYSWENILIAQLSVTLGNLAGTVGCVIADTDFEADTIAVTYGNDNVTISVVDNGADVRGSHVLMSAIGSQLVQFEFNMNSSAVSANAIVKKM